MDSWYVALLRGVNVGGKNLLSMKELSRLFLEAGGVDAQTYIQSGNVVYRAKTSRAEKIAVTVCGAIEAELGVRTHIVIRSREELQEALEHNPFLAKGHDEKHLSLVFLARKPEAEAMAKLDPQRSPGDEFVVRGREIYLYQPNGVAGSKLTNAYFDSKLATVSTGRNWRTVCRLREMMQT